MDSDDYSFRYDIGIFQPSHAFKLSDKDKICTLISKYYSFLRVKAELDQIVSGLSSTLNMFELIRSHSSQMKELFLYKPQHCLTWEDLLNLLPAKFSVDGCNRREREEAVFMKWISVLKVIDGWLTINWFIMQFCN